MSSKYTVEARVRRAGGSKLIEWEWEGRGSGTMADHAWKKLRATNRTIDTDEPIMSGAVLRDGVVVESIGGHQRL